MTRLELEHLIRAAGNIADDQDLIVIGSQAILGQFPDAPSEFLASMEADLIPRTHADRHDLIDGTIGENSPFHNLFGYYAHGVEEKTAILPDGWRDRLVLVTGENTSHVRGWCLEVHDLAIAKLAAGRDKDLDFTAALIRHGMVRRDVLDERLTVTPLAAETRHLISQRIARQFAAS